MANYTSIYASGQAVDQVLQRGEEAWTKINSGEVGGGKIEMLYNGTNITVDGAVVNFKQIVDYLTVDNKFTYLLYNNMAYLTTKIDTTSSLKQVVFESSHVDGGMGKIFTITVNSSDGVTIASINHTNVANENYSNKVGSIAENDKKSTVHYPSNKAVTDITDNKVDKISGKGLSTNDYTNEEKSAVATLKEDLLVLNYQNINIKNELNILGKYIRSEQGIYWESENYCSTSFIPVKSGDKINYNLCGANEHISLISFYSTDNVVESNRQPVDWVESIVNGISSSEPAIGSYTFEADGFIIVSNLINHEPVLYFGNANISQKITADISMDNEFVLLGGTFGRDIDESKRVINSNALYVLYQKYNAIIFDNLSTIEVRNFSLSLTSNAVLKNFTLYTFYSESYPYTLGSTGRCQNLTIDKVALNNNNKALCPAGMWLGASDQSVYSPYSMLSNITIVGYYYSLTMFAWNTKISRMHIERCDYSAILLGTTYSIDNIYSLQCVNGVSLGVFFTETGEAVYNDLCYFAVSTIDVLSTDTGTATLENMLSVGRVKNCNINIVAGEGESNVNYVIRSYNQAFAGRYDSGCNLKIGAIRLEYRNVLNFYNSVNDNGINDFFILGDVYSYRISKKIASAKTNITLLHPDEYLNSLAATFVDGILSTTSQTQTTSNITLGGNFKNFKGTDEQQDILFGYGRTVGTITTGNVLRLYLYSMVNRKYADTDIIASVKLTIMNADSHNDIIYSGDIMINAIIENYVKGETYLPTVTPNNVFDISISSGGSTPQLIIKPKSELNIANYFYKLEGIAGSVFRVQKT